MKLRRGIYTRDVDPVENAWLLRLCASVERAVESVVTLNLELRRDPGPFDHVPSGCARERWEKFTQ